MAPKIVACHCKGPNLRRKFEPTSTLLKTGSRQEGGCGEAPPVESEDETSNRVKVFRERGTRNETAGTFDFSQANNVFIPSLAVATTVFAQLGSETTGTLEALERAHTRFGRGARDFICLFACSAPPRAANNLAPGRKE